jgi:hypothetical protein
MRINEKAGERIGYEFFYIAFLIIAGVFIASGEWLGLIPVILSILWVRQLLLISIKSEVKSNLIKKLENK